MTEKKIKKILIISVSGMGTTIMFLPLLELIKTKFPKAEISILVGSKFIEKILSNNKYIDKIFSWDFFDNSRLSTIRYLFSLRSERFDVSINVYPNLRRSYNIISFLIGAKTKISHTVKRHSFQRLSFLINRKVYANFQMHDIKNNQNLLKLLGISRSEWTNPRLYLSDSELINAQKFFLKNNILETDKKIGVHVGDNPSSKGRNWPAQKYVNLFNVLIQRKMKIIVFSTMEERPIVNEIKEKTSGEIFIFENSDIMKVAGIISQCNCFLTDDSGLMHLASCVQTPIIALFGPTNKKWTGPLSDTNKIIETGIECSPCLDRIKTPKGKDKNKFNLIKCHIEDKFACMKYIEEEEVLAAIDEFVSKKSNF